MDKINSQTKLLRAGYVYLGIFLIASLFGVFFAFSGAIDDVAVGYTVQGFEPATQNYFTSIFFAYGNLSLVLRIFMLAGIAVLILNIAGVKKFMPALILTTLVTANPFLIGVFKLQSAFAALPAVFFALLAVVISLHVRSLWKHLSYLLLFVSALFMAQIAIASAFMILLYQLLPVSIKLDTKLPKQPKKLALFVFFLFFALLITELLVLGDLVQFKLISEQGLFAPASDIGRGTMFFFVPFVQRLNSLGSGASGIIYLIVFVILSLSLVATCTKFIISKKKKLVNLRQNLTALYWSMGLLIFLLISAFFTELNQFVNASAFFGGIALIICVYALTNRLKFKTNMIVGLFASAIAIVFAFTSVLSQPTWDNKETLMRNLAKNSDYSRYAQAQLAEFAYNKALETNNPQIFDENHKEFKELLEKYMQNPYPQTSVENLDQPVNTSTFAELDILLDFTEILQQIADHDRFLGLNLPDTELQDTTQNMQNPDEIRGMIEKLTRLLEKKQIEKDKYGYFINFEFYNALRIMLPEFGHSETNRQKRHNWISTASNSEFQLHNGVETSFLLGVPLNKSLSDLERDFYTKFILTFGLEYFVKPELQVAFVEAMKVDEESADKTPEILKTLIIADQLIKGNEIIVAKFDANKISTKLLEMLADNISPNLQAEIILRRGLLYQFTKQLKEEAIKNYDRIIELSKLNNFRNPALVSHVMYLKALIQHEKGFTKDALVLLDTAIAQSKHNYAAQILRGEIRFDAARQRLEELIIEFTREYRALPEDKQNPVVERSKYVPIWELERAFYTENESYRTYIQNIENNLAAAYEVDNNNKQLAQTLADLLFYRGYGQRALKNTDLAELALRRSYNMNPNNTTEILGAKIADVLGQFYFEVWSAYLIGEGITEENQAEVNDLLTRALQLSAFVRDQLYGFVQQFIKDHPDLKPESLLPFYQTAKEIYPDWVPARRWLAEFYRNIGAQDRWEEEFMALLKYTEDREEWPALNLECSQSYLIWASYGLRKLQNIQDPEELKRQAAEIQKLFEKSNKYNDVFARFGDSEFLYWQNRSILYQRWADLLVSLNDNVAWMEKINKSIESFEHYLNLDVIDANNAAIASLYRSKFMYLWRINQADWYKNNENWEKTGKTSEMMECMTKYKDWTLKPHEKAIAENEIKIAELNKELEGYKKSGFEKKINDLSAEIAEIKNKNTKLKDELAKTKRINAWLYNYITVMQGIDAFQAGELADALKFFQNSYNNIKGAYDAFWIGRIYELQGYTDFAIRWYLVSATRYSHALVKISEILDDNAKAASIDKLYLKTYLTLTESMKNVEVVSDVRKKVTAKMQNKEPVKSSDELKLHRAKLDGFLVDLAVEGSDSSILSFILGQCDEIEGDFVSAFRNYISSTTSANLFYQASFRTASAIYKNEEYNYLSLLMLEMLENALIFGTQDEFTAGIKADTEQLLTQIKQSFADYQPIDEEVERLTDFVSKSSEGLHIPVYDYILADLLVLKKDFKEAEEKYTNANSSEFLFLPAKLAVAEMFFGMENMKPRAYLAYKELINLFKQTGKEKLVEQIPEESKNHYNSILDEYSRLLNAGKKAYEEKDYKETIENLEECFRFVRSGVTANIIADSYRKLNDIINAESWYITTIQSDEIILHAYFDLAEMLENVPEKRWRAFWALNKLLDLVKDSQDDEVLKLAEDAGKMLKRLNNIKNMYFEEGKAFFIKSDYDKAYDSFKLSYNVNESSETAYFVGRSLLESWKKTFDSSKPLNLQKLKDSENWFIIAAEAEQGNPVGYFDLGTTYFKFLNQTSKTSEFYELFLKKTAGSKDEDINSMRETAITILKIARDEVQNSMADGEKLFKEKKYQLANNKFMINFKATGSSESALWIGRCQICLDNFDYAQDWFLFAADELPEALYEYADALNAQTDFALRLAAMKYYESFIAIVHDIDKYKDSNKLAAEKYQKLEADLAQQLNNPFKIDEMLVKSKHAFNNLYETGMLLFKDSSKWWIADIYLEAFVKFINEMAADPANTDIERYLQKAKKARETQDIIEKAFDDSMDKAYDYKKNNENDKAIAEYLKVLNMMRSFPADYSMLLQLLEQAQRYEELIEWSDISVRFYADADSDLQKRIYELYFYLNAKAHFEHGNKETGIEKLKSYQEQWKNGKYVDSVKLMLETATQTKPN